MFRSIATILKNKLKKRGQQCKLIMINHQVDVAFWMYAYYFNEYWHHTLLYLHKGLIIIIINNKTIFIQVNLFSKINLLLSTKDLCVDSVTLAMNAHWSLVMGTHANSKLRPYAQLFIMGGWLVFVYQSLCFQPWPPSFLLFLSLYETPIWQ